WQIEPASRVPTADKPGAPLVFDHIQSPILGAARKHTQRVSIQIDDAGGKIKLLLEGSKGILTVCCQAVFASLHRKRLLNELIESHHDKGAVLVINCKFMRRSKLFSL